MQYKWSGNVNIVMTEAKILTVVIPVYNRADIVGRTLQCLSEQDTRDFALILVDNNSQDDSLKVLQTWKNENPDIDCAILSEKKPGAAAARNCGLRNVTTEYVLFFDSDDVMFPEHISSAIRLLKTNPNVDILGWDINIQLSSGKYKKGRFYVKNPLVNHLIFSSISTQRFAVKTSFINSVGGWNEKVRLWDDYELGVRLLLAKPIILKRKGNIAVTTYFSEESLTSHTFLDNKENWEYPLNLISCHLKRSSGSILPWVGYRKAILAAEYLSEGSCIDAERIMNEISESGLNKRLAKLIFLCHKIFKRFSWIFPYLFLKKM